MSDRTRMGLVALLPCLAFGALACGHTEEEWQWQQDKLLRAQGDLSAAQTKFENSAHGCDADRRRAVELAAKLEESGIPLSGSGGIGGTAQEREHALAEARIHVRAAAEARVAADSLQKKLDELTPSGVAVGVRRGRLTIMIPGDFLFISPRGDTLSTPGQKALAKIAAALRADPTLVNRNYQVIGHTDDKKLDGGLLKDAIGVSVMHAREVIATLVAAGPFVGSHWSAAGYGPNDPIAPNDTDDNRRKNRRIEIVLLPPTDDLTPPTPEAPPHAMPTGP